MVLDKNGNPITEMVADGTVTYYDLWPGGDGVGKKNAGKDVEASYNVIENTTLDYILNNDITKSEGYAPEGVIRISSKSETDLNTKLAITDFMKIPKYNGRTRNCSDLAEVGVNSSLGIKIKANEFIPFKISTTPNKLYRKTTKQAGTVVLKNPGDKIKKSFLRGVLNL